MRSKCSFARVRHLQFATRPHTTSDNRMSRPLVIGKDAFKFLKHMLGGTTCPFRGADVVGARHCGSNLSDDCLGTMPIGPEPVLFCANMNKSTTSRKPPLPLRQRRQRLICGDGGFLLFSWMALFQWPIIFPRGLALAGPWSGYPAPTWLSRLSGNDARNGCCGSRHLEPALRGRFFAARRFDAFGAKKKGRLPAPSPIIVGRIRSRRPATRPACCRCGSNAFPDSR